jgi:DNA-binding MarR family transcriptional regulator
MKAKQSLSDSLNFRISQLSQMLDRELQHALAEYGVTSSQWIVLAAIAIEDAKTPSAIADYLAADGAAVSRHLDTLVKKGLLHRVPFPDDRRSIKIELTEECRGLIPMLAEKAQSVDRKFSERLSNSELEQFRLFLQKLEGESPHQTSRAEDWEIS